MRHDDTKRKETSATLSPEELARTLSVSRHGIYTGLRNGSIPSIRLGRRFVIPRAAINDWLRTAGRPES
jgi:excisionase family DNA binding protein